MATKPTYTGGIFQCAYCGERFGKKALYCPATCRTEPGRKAIFDENVKIALANKALGFTVPEGFLNWKAKKKSFEI